MWNLLCTCMYVCMLCMCIINFCVLLVFFYSFIPPMSNGRPMLNISLNLNLLTPEIARGEIKRFHVNVNTERLVGGAMGNFTPINVCRRGWFFSTVPGVPPPPPTNQINQWLLYPSLWLLISIIFVFTPGGLYRLSWWCMRKDWLCICLNNH